MITRRNFITTMGIAGSALSLPSRTLAYGEESKTGKKEGNRVSSPQYIPVETPDGSTLPFKEKDGVKIFHLTASTLKKEIAPGLTVTCWGYNGQAPGPTIEAVEGDRVRIYVTNGLPEHTTIHWHGILLPSGMDGVGGLSQKRIPPGETYKYEFTLQQFGTHMYHPHQDEMTQIALGMMGLFVIHPKDRADIQVDRDFALILSEWRIDPGTTRPYPFEMTDFNIFTINGKAFPGTAPLVIKTGQKVRIRIGNLSPMDHHPIHLHGYQFKVTATDGGRIQDSAQWQEVTVLVPVGSTRDIEFTANNPGDWALHCHMTHHTMNQMGHNIPNLIGIDKKGIDKKLQKHLPEYMTMGETGMSGMEGMDMPVPKNSIPMRGGKGPFGPIDMGGMFTILKVRDELTDYNNPGWYKNPSGTVAEKVSRQELEEDLNIQKKKS